MVSVAQSVWRVNIPYRKHSGIFISIIAERIRYNPAYSFLMLLIVKMTA